MKEPNTVESTDTGSTQEPKKVKKLSPLQKIRNLFHYKVKISTHENADEESNTLSEEPEINVDKSEKKKKPKKKKEKKPKKPKPKKVKKKARKSGDQSEKGGKSKILLFLAIIGVLALISAAIIVFFLVRGGGDKSQNQLAKARKYIESEKYTKAVEIYDKLIEDDIELVECYLGLADAYEGAEDLSSAIFSLKEGYQRTGNELIGERLDELSPGARDEQELLPTNKPIVFQDEAFEAMLRQAMNRDASSPIYPADLDMIQNLRIYGNTHAVINGQIPVINTMDGYTVDGVTYTQRGEIRSLGDLIHFRNLVGLTISHNQIQDIRGIEHLQKIQGLGLYCNDITDLSPVKSLSTLERLYIYDNQIVDLSPLSELENLRQLLVQHNQVQDISPLGKLVNMEELFIGFNNIQDISAISGMQNLYYLYAQDNQIQDIGVVSNLTKLSDISFVNNPVQDYTPAEHIQNINRPFGVTN